MGVTTFLLALLSQDDPKVDNPQYKDWARFKVGSWARLKTEHQSNGPLYQTETTLTLLELDADRAVVEVKYRDNASGKWKDDPPIKTEIRARVSEADLRSHRLAVTVDVKPKEQEETLEIGGKKVRCKRLDYEAGMQAHGESYRIWYSEEIPGGVAKSEHRTWDTQPPLVGATCSIVESWEIK